MIPLYSDAISKSDLAIAVPPLYEAQLQDAPLFTDQLYRVFRNRSILSAAGRANKEAIGWEARNQFHGEPLTDPLAVTIDIYGPDRRKHDVDNVKELLDAVNGIVWDDDGQILDLRTRKHFDKDDPRLVLSVGCTMEPT